MLDFTKEDRELRAAMLAWTELKTAMYQGEPVRPSREKLKTLSGYKGTDRYMRGGIGSITLVGKAKVRAVIGGE